MIIRLALFLVICSLLFVMMKSLTNFLGMVSNIPFCSESVRLKRLFKVVISQGGVVPHIAPELLPTKSKKGDYEE